MIYTPGNAANNAGGKLYGSVGKPYKFKSPPLYVMSLRTRLVGPKGFEPFTSTTSMWRSSQMS